MTDALARLRADVTRDYVLRAIQEYDQLGPERFLSEHGFGPSRSYELVWGERRYPHKAILGTAYEFATGGQRVPCRIYQAPHGVGREIAFLHSARPREPRLRSPAALVIAAV